MRVEWSPRALSDLKTLSEFIEQDRSLETANRIVGTIYNAVQRLAAMPHSGRRGRVLGTRELPVSRLPYIIVYRVLPERLQIVNVVHGAQRWP
jgi:addiction module RelE/StbE family toxin